MLYLIEWDAITVIHKMMTFSLLGLHVAYVCFRLLSCLDILCCPDFTVFFPGLDVKLDRWVAASSSSFRTSASSREICSLASVSWFSDCSNFSSNSSCSNSFCLRVQKKQTHCSYSLKYYAHYVSGNTGYYVILEEQNFCSFLCMQKFH